MSLRLRGGTRKHQQDVQPASNATIRGYVRAAKGFCSWFCVAYELPDAMLAGLGGPDPSKTRRHVRRTMQLDEWCRLEVTTTNGPDRQGISGPERALAYAAMLATGYRKEETRKLTRGSLQRAGGSWALALSGERTKNGQNATQRIPDTLAKQLQDHASTKLPNAPLLAMPERFDIARVLRADLKAAREEWIKEATTNKERKRREQSDFLAYEDHQKRKLDVHALRHTCATGLLKPESGCRTCAPSCGIHRSSSPWTRTDTSNLGTWT